MEASKEEEEFRSFEMQNGEVTYGKYSPPTEQGERVPGPVTSWSGAQRHSLPKEIILASEK